MRIGLVLSLLLVCNQAFALTCTGAQNDFRYRFDNGTETSATWQAATNTNVTETAIGSNLRLRIASQCSGAPNGCGAIGWQYAYSYNGGAYTNITTSSSVMVAITSPNVTNGTATTNIIGGTPFYPGTVTATGASSTATMPSSGGNTETELIYQFVSGSVNNGDTVAVKALPGQCSVSFAYNEIPQATISIVSGSILNLFSMIHGVVDSILDGSILESRMSIKWSTTKGDNANGRS